MHTDPQLLIFSRSSMKIRRLTLTLETRSKWDCFAAIWSTGYSTERKSKSISLHLWTGWPRKNTNTLKLSIWLTLRNGFTKKFNKILKKTFLYCTRLFFDQIIIDFYIFIKCFCYESHIFTTFTLSIFNEFIKKNDGKWNLFN